MRALLILFAVVGVSKTQPVPGIQEVKKVCIVGLVSLLAALPLSGCLNGNGEEQASSTPNITSEQVVQVQVGDYRDPHTKAEEATVPFGGYLEVPVWEDFDGPLKVTYNDPYKLDISLLVDPAQVVNRDGRWFALIPVNDFNVFPETYFFRGLKIFPDPDAPTSDAIVNLNLKILGPGEVGHLVQDARIVRSAVSKTPQVVNVSNFALTEDQLKNMKAKVTFSSTEAGHVKAWFPGNEVQINGDFLKRGIVNGMLSYKVELFNKNDLKKPMYNNTFELPQQANTPQK